VLGKSSELCIRADPSKDLGISRCDHTATLTLERSCNDRRTTATSTGIDDGVDEVD